MRGTHERETESGRGFMSGLIWGVAAGAALGLLFAPKPGSELRRDMSKSATRLRKRAIETYDRAADTVEDLVERGQEAVSEVVNHGEAALERGREAFEQARHPPAPSARTAP